MSESRYSRGNEVRIKGEEEIHMLERKIPVISPYCLIISGLDRIKAEYPEPFIYELENKRLVEENMLIP